MMKTRDNDTPNPDPGADLYFEAQIMPITSKQYQKNTRKHTSNKNQNHTAARRFDPQHVTNTP
jgi:hypothetical protein